MSRTIAMWSGPRNISTALMRSFGNRSDTFVCDEPFYAHYLLTHGQDHPGREEVLRHHDSDAIRVADWLVSEVPQCKEVFYQKHMAHHLLDDVPRGWLDQVTHCFLIREPKEMLTSLLQVLPEPSLFDTGLPQQVELFESRQARGETPPVVDARDVLTDPRSLLTSLCERLGLPFEETMLSWPAGRRDTDGVWAPYWYSRVEESTGFEPYRPKDIPVPPHLGELLEVCNGYYNRMAVHRLS